MMVTSPRVPATRLAAAIAFMALALIPAAWPQETPQKIYAFKNGRWFDGQGFENATFYSVHGILTKTKPDRIDQTVNLEKGYVVPPYAEAHNHNVDASEAGRAMIQRYLREGIFYVKNPNNLPRDKEALADVVNKPTSIDVVFANGGLTASGGHPIQIAERGIQGGWMKPGDGEGGFYYTIDTLDDLNAKWDGILSTHPDFIKTYLLYSEGYEKRKDDPAYFDWKGLNPDLLPAIVQRAHDAGLRVSTHIETAADFQAAVEAGVDEINHTPGFRPQPGIPLDRYALTDAQAEAAARKGIFVVTTLGGIHPPEVKELHRHNIDIMQKHGVRIAVGSDQHNYTSTLEARYLSRLGAFTNLELLKAWCETSPATIFPNRKIGKLEEGYEASFLVLDENPLHDFSNTSAIRLWVKQGVILDIAD